MTQYLSDNARSQHAHVLAPASARKRACLLLTERYWTTTR